jgi:hypothetical protein
MRTDANGLTVYFPISFTATPFPITARGCARSGLPWGKALGISQPRSGLPIAVGYRCANAMKQPFQGRRSFWGAIPRVGRGASNPGLQEETAFPYRESMALRIRKIYRDVWAIVCVYFPPIFCGKLLCWGWERGCSGRAGARRSQVMPPPVSRLLPPLQRLPVAPAFAHRFFDEGIELRAVGDASGFGIPLDVGLETLGQHT